ncbi:MAG: hypothetical protein H6642_17295 [Caldilineaceae bacterium]|nr:hypothetical protein [Caldilineaceae bacterium]MCB9140100.1 hypothetical protein [Caldilineaceae bacterium]
MEAFLTPELAATAGLWVGLIISLMLFSLLLGDNRPARLGQYLLVGAGLAYAVALAWRSVLLPRLFLPLREEPGDWQLWLPLLLGALLLLAGIERVVRQGSPAGPWRVLHTLGALPLALITGVAMSVGVIGAWQGTLWPQFSRAVVTGFPWTSPPAALINGVLMLLITSGVLVHLRSRPGFLAQQPPLLRGLLRGWAWIGARGLWLAAGVLFARLLLSRLTLTIAELEFLIARLQQTELGQWIGALWQQIVG